LAIQLAEGIPVRHFDDCASLQDCEQSPAAETPGIKAKLTNDAKEKDNKFNFINFIITFNLLAI
jgi:hypothetical protein